MSTNSPIPQSGTTNDQLAAQITAMQAEIAALANAGSGGELLLGQSSGVLGFTLPSAGLYLVSDGASGAKGLFYICNGSSGGTNVSYGLNATDNMAVMGGGLNLTTTTAAYIRYIYKIS